MIHVNTTKTGYLYFHFSSVPIGWKNTIEEKIEKIKKNILEKIEKWNDSKNAKIKMIKSITTPNKKKTEKTPKRKMIRNYKFLTFQNVTQIILFHPYFTRILLMFNLHFAHILPW